MNPFEDILLQLTEAASAEFLQLLFASLSKKLNPKPAPAAAPVVAAAPAAMPLSTGILNGMGSTTSVSVSSQTS